MERAERGERGERLTITRAGRPVAQLVALPRSPAPLDELRQRWAKLPDVDPVRLRRDVDDLLDPLPFDAAAARSFGRVAASLWHAGRKSTARAYDVMIAAVCVASELPIHTCNPHDFTGIDGLAVVDVAHPDH